MTLRARKTKEVCKKFKVLEEKFHSEKSVFFNLPRASLNDLEKRTTHYQDYYNKTQECLNLNKSSLRLQASWDIRPRPRRSRPRTMDRPFDPWSAYVGVYSEFKPLKQAKYDFPFYPYGLSLNAYWKTGTQLLQHALAHALLLDLDYTIKTYKKSINIYSPRPRFIKKCRQKWVSRLLLRQTICRTSNSNIMNLQKFNDYHLQKVCSWNWPGTFMGRS